MNREEERRGDEKSREEEAPSFKDIFSTLYTHREYSPRWGRRISWGFNNYKDYSASSKKLPPKSSSSLSSSYKPRPLLFSSLFFSSSSSYFLPDFSFPFTSHLRRWKNLLNPYKNERSTPLPSLKKRDSEGEKKEKRKNSKYTSSLKWRSSQS